MNLTSVIAVFYFPHIRAVGSRLRGPESLGDEGRDVAAADFPEDRGRLRLSASLSLGSNPTAHISNSALPTSGVNTVRAPR